jgi:hypothetical protein
MPDLDTQLADYADWLADRAGPVSAEEATTSPAPAVTLEPDDHEVATARRRRTRLVAAVAAVAAVLVLGVLMATLLPTSDQDDVETAAVAPGTDLRTGWERIPVDWGGGTPIDVASNGEGILRAVVATSIGCSAPDVCSADLYVWESTDNGRSWRQQGQLAAGGSVLEGNSDNYRSAVAISGNGSNWIVAGNRSDQPVVWLPTPDDGWAERELPGRPGLPRAALAHDDGTLLVVGGAAGQAVAWVSGDAARTWTVEDLTVGEPVPGGLTSAGTPAATALVAVADEVLAFGVGAGTRPLMWARNPDGGWTEEVTPAEFALARTTTDDETIWAVEAFSLPQSSQVELWARRDRVWQQTGTGVPWSIVEPDLEERAVSHLRNMAPALAANGNGVVLASGEGDRQRLWASPDREAWSPTDAPTAEGTTIVALTDHGDGFVALGPNEAWVWQPR